ncbi:peptidoglycan-binding protein [Streptomyces sp. NPDC059443]|uniref:peptidoglycan-binding domain-containing protein n=1 Tax=Streptomyces sp. NPDC059443 TaxID=3346831 RepID=UPI0036A0919D
MRIRPYVSLPDLGRTGAPPPEARTHPEAHTRPVPHVRPGTHATGATGASAEAHTPAYGTPVAATASTSASWPDETIQLRPVPAPGHTPGAARARRRVRALPIAAAVTVIATAALAVTAFSGSGKPDPETVLLDVKPTSPLTGLPSAAPAQTSASAKPSPSLSRSPSPSRSASASPSPTPTPSPTRSSAPAVTPSPTPSRPASSPPPSQAPTLQYGDSGPEVEKIQRLLSAQGYYRGKFDGKFGDRTRSAVSTFQWENGVEGDPYGVYGPQTRRALEG